MSEKQRKRWGAAPSASGREFERANAVVGVYLSDGEVVQWVWTHSDNLSYVSGYRIVSSQEDSAQLTRLPPITRLPE